MDIREICIPIREEMKSLEDFIRQTLTSKVSFVQSVVEYVIQNGGKRLRPVLTIMSAKMLGYQGEAGIAIGAAIEFMHTASLLHDDVLDNATLRRGRATPNKKWGNHVSVLVGDFFYCRAMDILVKHGDLRVLRTVTDAVTTTTEGEILEIIRTNDLGLSEEEYLQIIHGKTAALISAACEAGAMLGQVSEELEQNLSKFGLHLGMAFQLMDDVLDYTSTAEEFGKKQGIDLAEGKLTLPLILSLKRSTDSEAQFIRQALLADKIDGEVFAKILHIVEKYDGIRDTTRLALSYVEKAKEKLAALRPSLEKDALLNLADYVVTRRN